MCDEFDGCDDDVSFMMACNFNFVKYFVAKRKRTQATQLNRNLSKKQSYIQHIQFLYYNVSI